MSVSIDRIQPQGYAPSHHGFAIAGSTQAPQQNIHIYYEIPSTGVQSANLPAVSDDAGNWSAVFPGNFKTGTEITVFARSGSAALAWLTKEL